VCVRHSLHTEARLSLSKAEVKLKQDNNLTLQKRDEREREAARKYKVFFSHTGRWLSRLDGRRYVLVQLAFC
jgi:hypothetical protein